jgi:hypothetical protein
MMKKIIAILTAMAFALTLGVAFAEDQPAPAGGEQKMEKKEMKKKKKKAEKKKAHKHKEMKEMKKEEAAPEYK